MASGSKKRKRATALFEVITKSKEYHRPKPPAHARVGLLSAARRWLKDWTRPSASAGTSGEAEVVTGTAAHRVAALEESRLEVRPAATAEADDRLVEAAAPLAPAADATAVQAGADVVSYAAPDYEPPPAPQASTDYPDLVAGEPPQNLAVAVDPERRQISLRMSYTVAIVAGFAVVVIVALSVIVGQHLNRRSVPLLAQTTTDELRKQPPHREVLDPIRHVNGTTPATPQASIDRPAEGQQIRPLSGNAGGGAAGPGAGEAAHPGTAVSTLANMSGDGKRYIGLNYVIVQGYPETELKMAEDAAAFLNKEGLNCTVEKGVKGYLTYTVVGLQGFDKQSSPALKTYMDRIKQLSTKYASNNRSFKAFTPTPKKWDKQD